MQKLLQKNNDLGRVRPTNQGHPMVLNSQSCDPLNRKTATAAITIATVDGRNPAPVDR